MSFQVNMIEEDALNLMRRASDGCATEGEMTQLKDLLGSSPSLAQTLQTTAQIRGDLKLKGDLQISKYYLDFGTKDKKCSLNAPVTDKIRIVNSGNSTVRIKFPESMSKPYLYNLTVTPHDFKLKKCSSIDITVEITVQCTTKLKEILTMHVLDGPCHFFSLSVCSVMSQILDYSELNIGKIIGTGGFGTVHKATWRGLPVAVKKITHDGGEGFDQEVAVHREIAHHPNVVHFVGVCLSPKVTVCEFIEGGSLDKYLNAIPRLGKRIRLKLALEVAKGMMFLHANDLLHLDLKPQNFLVVSLSNNAPVSIKLTDFGLSLGSSQTFRGRRVEGSFLYMAPEVLLNAQFSRAADVWSYGAVLIEILTDCKPYYQYDHLTYLQMVQKRSEELEMPSIPDCLTDPELVDLINACLRLDRSKRPTFEQIVHILDNYIDNNHETLVLESPHSPEPVHIPVSLLTQDLLSVTPVSSPKTPRSATASPKTSPPSSAPSSPSTTPPFAAAVPRNRSPSLIGNRPSSPIGRPSSPTVGARPSSPLGIRPQSPQKFTPHTPATYLQPPHSPILAHARRPPSPSLSSSNLFASPILSTSPTQVPRLTLTKLLDDDEPVYHDKNPMLSIPDMPPLNLADDSPYSNKTQARRIPPPVPPRSNMKSPRAHSSTSPPAFIPALTAPSANTLSPLNHSQISPREHYQQFSPRELPQISLTLPSPRDPCSPRDQPALIFPAPPSHRTKMASPAPSPRISPPATPRVEEDISSPPLDHIDVPHFPKTPRVSPPAVSRVEEKIPSPPSAPPRPPRFPQLSVVPPVVTIEDQTPLSPRSMASAEIDDPKIDSLRSLTQSSFMAVVHSLEQVAKLLHLVYSLKASIEVSKQVLAYKRSLESACETFCNCKFDEVRQFLNTNPRPPNSLLTYSPPPLSLFSSPDSHANLSALLSKTTMVLGQALDIVHYFTTRLSSTSHVTEVLTLAKCARWLKNNAQLELSEETVGRIRAASVPDVEEAGLVPASS